MKIVSFAHYTCGGLLCDIMNNTFSEIGSHGGLESIHHNLGKIGDSATVYRNFDLARLEHFLRQSPARDWIGTHCWLGNVNAALYDQVINITTVTQRSRLYRWIRAYNHYYLTSLPWQRLDRMESIDKQRETAKNYLQASDPIHNSKVINLEFADVVEEQAAFVALMPANQEKHMSRWREVNFFLYAPDVWRSEAADRFHEAEYEQGLAQRYRYE